MALKSSNLELQKKNFCDYVNLEFKAENEPFIPSVALRSWLSTTDTIGKLLGLTN